MKTLAFNLENLKTHSNVFDDLISNILINENKYFVQQFQSELGKNYVLRHLLAFIVFLDKAELISLQDQQNNQFSFQT